MIHLTPASVSLTACGRREILLFRPDSAVSKHRAFREHTIYVMQVDWNTHFEYAFAQGLQDRVRALEYASTEDQVEITLEHLTAEFERRNWTGSLGIREAVTEMRRCLREV